MKRSEQINELAAALAKAQTDFEAAEREHTANVETRTGGKYSFNYADLAAYMAVCRGPLGKNGLSIMQEATVKGAEVSVVTLLMHSSGQLIESEPFVLKMIGQGEKELITPQVIGSGITYARRYSLSALIGMASEADDDGNEASGNRAETGKREPAKQRPPCPKCGKAASVIVGKADFGGGLVCWKNKDGCGHAWATPEFPSTKDHPAENGQTAPAQLPPDNTAALLAWDARLDPQKNFDLGTDKGHTAILEEFKAINGKDPIRPVVWNRILKTMESMGFYFQHKTKTFVQKEPANNEEFA